MQRLNGTQVQPHRYGKRVVVMALGVLLLMGSTGCAPQTRHDLLTFFFTGVPPLEAPASDAAGQKRAEQIPSRRQEHDQSFGRHAAVQPQADPAKAAPQKPRFYSHPIWYDGDCAACHQGSGIFGFQAARQQKKPVGERIFHGGGGMPGALLSPKEMLCTGCHTDKTGIRAIKEQLWLHNTTAKGDCLACHDAHQSGNPGVLRRPADQLCQTCHTTEKLAGIPMHRGGTEPCLSCHNPHMGKDRSLLTRDYREVRQGAVRRQLGDVRTDSDQVVGPQQTGKVTF